ncbi:succinate dehydrogenase assembly factor 2 [Pelagibacterales bacterium SAG-MED13]|nr:succinate dehydrogenase assembly factor 2 [Pelagibacterales bacterium SAG-MED13]|tara:strand:+ start:226 stop:486 length:261 start_codon:yes stop_codon:yes gene_type:complete
MNSEIEKYKKKLLYRSQYRGTKEMDKLIGNFVKKYINVFDKNELVELEKFLNIDDDTLYKFYNNQISHSAIEQSKITILFKNYIYK